MNLTEQSAYAAHLAASAELAGLTACLMGLAAMALGLLYLHLSSRKEDRRGRS